MSARRVFGILIAFLIVFGGCPVCAASGPTVTTTLTDGALQRGSKKTFDVRARNAAGEKIRATVLLNGQPVAPTWDDDEKTSYTLVFAQSGEYTVTVSATSDGGRKAELTYKIPYQKAAPGDVIGTAVWSVELFTIGCGYLIAPVRAPIREGETSADQLLRLIAENGLNAYYGGSPKSGFYLGYIADGTTTESRFEGYQKSAAPQSPKKLELSPAVPTELAQRLRQTTSFFDPDDYANWSGHIGEFVISNGAGFMYSVNNAFPNVGFSDTYLSDGDTVRVQFTLAYGADVGGAGALGGKPGAGQTPAGFYAVADKDALTRAIADAVTSGLTDRANVAAAYAQALQTAQTLWATQSAVDAATAALLAALASPQTESASAAGGFSPPARQSGQPPVQTVQDPGTAPDVQIDANGADGAPSDNTDDNAREDGGAQSAEMPKNPAKSAVEPDKTPDSARETEPPDASDDSPRGAVVIWVVVAAILAAAALGGAAVVKTRRARTANNEKSDENGKKSRVENDAENNGQNGDT